MFLYPYDDPHHSQSLMGSKFDLDPSFDFFGRSMPLFWVNILSLGSPNSRWDSQSQDVPDNELGLNSSRVIQTELTMTVENNFAECLAQVTQVVCCFYFCSSLSSFLNMN